MTGSNAPSAEPHVTERARAVLGRQLRGQSADASVWVEVIGGTRADPTYDVYVAPLQTAQPGDAVLPGWPPLVVPSGSRDVFDGATIDVGDASDRLVVRHPRQVIPDEPAVERVERAIHKDLGPMLASHGGGIELVAIDDGVAQIRMTGGCQGCGAATTTVSEGVAASLRAAAPELRGVLDVTDHGAGTSPFLPMAPNDP